MTDDDITPDTIDLPPLERPPLVPNGLSPRAVHILSACHWRTIHIARDLGRDLDPQSKQIIWDASGDAYQLWRSLMGKPADVYPIPLGLVAMHRDRVVPEHHVILVDGRVYDTWELVRDFIDHVQGRTSYYGSIPEDAPIGDYVVVVAPLQ